MDKTDTLYGAEVWNSYSPSRQANQIYLFFWKPDGHLYFPLLDPKQFKGVVAKRWSNGPPECRNSTSESFILAKEDTVTV